jgi:hypothetical protein
VVRFSEKWKKHKTLQILPKTLQQIRLFEAAQWSDFAQRGKN